MSVTRLHGVLNKWVYAGAFDPTVLVQDAGVDAVVGTITGDATTTVDAVSEVNIDGVPTLVTKLRLRRILTKVVWLLKAILEPVHHSGR